MKLKALLALTVTLTLGVAAAQGTTSTTTQAPTLSDVPAGHWAADAVSRLVSEGVILGFPDGTFRGNENLTRYQAAVIIARVLDQIAQGNVQVEGDTMTSLQNAVQELAADLAALGVRVADLEENAATKDDIARIEERLNDLGVAGGDEGATAELQGALDELTARVDELSSNFDTLRADVDDNASSIAALNDLTVLLNQDILSLQDRVSALETGKADRADLDALTDRVGGIDTRLGAVEALPRVTLTGGFGVSYGGVSFSGVSFDIDRMSVNTFAGGLGDGDVTTPGAASAATPGATLTFGLGVSNIRTANNTFTITNANLNFGVNALGGAPVGGNTTVFLTGASVTGTVANQPFSATYSATGSTFEFNRMFFRNTGGRGVVATIQANSLPFAPKITAVVGNGSSTTPTTFPGAYAGIRAEINPFGVGMLGLSAATNSVYDGFSADANFNVGPVALNSIYALSLPRVEGAPGASAFYIAASSNLGIFNLGGNFRSIDAAFANPAEGTPGARAGMGGTPPFAAGTSGFGFGARTSLGIVNLGGYFDSATTTATGALNTRFGVSAQANVFRGLGVQAFYNSFSVAGVPTAAAAGANLDYDANYTQPGGTLSTAAAQVLAPAPLIGSSSFGVALRHNGSAPDALLAGLNLTAGYANFYTVGASDIQVFGSYRADLGGIGTITPFARYHTNSGGTATTADAAGVAAPAVAYSTFKVGAQLTTTPLNTVFSPSVTGGVSYRSTAFAGGGATTELYANGNLVLNNLFDANTSLGFGYSTYTASGVGSVATGLRVGAANGAFSPSIDNVYGAPSAAFVAGPGGDSGSVSGFFTQLNIYGVRTSYGVFSMDSALFGASAAQTFRVGYDVRF